MQAVRSFPRYKSDNFKKIEVKFDYEVDASLQIENISLGGVCLSSINTPTFTEEFSISIIIKKYNLVIKCELCWADIIGDKTVFGVKFIFPDQAVLQKWLGLLTIIDGKFSTISSEN